MAETYSEFANVMFKQPDSAKALYDTLWSINQTPWETSEAHLFLREHSSGLDLTPPKRVFVPFCGNAIEMKWFYEKGHEVVGVDFVEVSVKKFFTQHNLPFEVQEFKGNKVYETSDKRLKIYACNFYDIGTDDVGKFDVIWDRNAQLAVKRSERIKYAEHIKSLCKEEFVYFMCTLQFEQVHDDPDKIPLSVSHEDSRKMFGEDWCKMELILQQNIIGTHPFYKGFGLKEVTESCFLLTPK